MAAVEFGVHGERVRDRNARKFDSVTAESSDCADFGSCGTIGEHTGEGQLRRALGACAEVALQSPLIVGQGGQGSDLVALSVWTLCQACRGEVGELRVLQLDGEDVVRHRVVARGWPIIVDVELPLSAEDVEPGDNLVRLVKPLAGELVGLRDGGCAVGSDSYRS